METPEEMRTHGKECLALAKRAVDQAAAEAFRRMAHAAFEMAALVERRGAMPVEH